MKQEEALYQLWRHAGLAEDIVETGLSGTAVGMLRPYQGLDEAVLESVRVAAVTLLDASLDQRTLLRAILALNQLTQVTRSWALDPDSMLTRNKLLAENDRDALIRWIRELEEVTKQIIEKGLRHIA